MSNDLPHMWLGRIIKNVALGSALIGQVAYSYYEETEQTEGIDLFRSILVLPMLFHSPTIEAIHGMRLKSGLVKAVLEKKITDSFVFWGGNICNKLEKRGKMGKIISV